VSKKGQYLYHYTQEEKYLRSVNEVSPESDVTVYCCLSETSLRTEKQRIFKRILLFFLFLEAINEMRYNYRYTLTDCTDIQMQRNKLVGK
jgi:hypothetical protein